MIGLHDDVGGEKKRKMGGSRVRLPRVVVVVFLLLFPKTSCTPVWWACFFVNRISTWLS
jgi:hypothetical protein